MTDRIRALPDFLKAWAAVLYLLFLDAVRKPPHRSPGAAARRVLEDRATTARPCRRR